MDCVRCGGVNPDVARYCYRCGTDPRRGERANTDYVVQPGEHLRQLAVVSTLMPHANREVADEFRWALAIGSVITLGFALTGLMAGAVVAAAVLVPVAYLVYIYDVNLWEDAPVPVVLGLFAFTGVVAAIVSWLFFKGPLADTYTATSLTRGGLGGISLTGLLIFAVVLPIIAEAIKQAAPAWLAAKPKFDDQIDGLTFGIASGTAYAAAETLVAFSGVFTSGQVRVTAGLGSWLVVILNLMIVKSIVYGSATGLAMAAYSGLGEGYDGFTPRWVRAAGIAVGANVAYWLGVRLLAYAPFGDALALLWGIVIAAALILRIRAVLQASLLEAALEAAQNDRRPAAAVTDGGWCPECEMPLLPDALFCVACGESVRATSATARHHIREHVTTGGEA
jgi:hypothetical protein